MQSRPQRTSTPQAPTFAELSRCTQLLLSDHSLVRVFLVSWLIQLFHISNLPRSTNSTPSPPRTDILRSRTSRHHRTGSFAPSSAKPVDWSTSYQASASSSAGAEEESSDDGTSSSGETVLTRGRTYRRSFNENHSANVSGIISQIKRDSQNIDPKQNTELADNYSPVRTAFTAQRSSSPATALRYTSRTPMVSTVKHNQTTLLPDTLRVTTRLSRINISFHFTLEFRTVIENLLLLVPLVVASYKYRNIPGYNGFRSWTFIEIPALIIFTVIYLISISLLPSVSIISPSPLVPVRPSSPLSTGTSPRAHADVRRSTVSACSVNKDNNLASRIWMSESRNYRVAGDDGAVTALLLAPLVATGMLIDSEYNLRSPHPSLLPNGWLIESPPNLPQTRHPLTALESLVQSRRNLVQLMSLSSMILLVHFYASRRSQAKQSETGLPKTEGSKTMSYVGFTCIVTAAALLLKMAFYHMGIDIWQDLDSFDVAVISFFYQFTLYVSLRLARQGFTVGELGLVAQGATALFMELVNLTIAKIWPITTPFIKTFRSPTPLLIYQLALIPGSLLIGFLLSPILVLSRHSARQPTKRLRNLKGNRRDRRFLALAFYGLAALIVGGLIGLWTRWCLDKRNPWLWVLLWLLEGRKQWSRIGFLVYWGFLGIISVAGWNRQLARARRYRHLAYNGGASVVVPAIASVNVVMEVSNESSPTMSGVNVGNVNVNVDRLTTAATEFLDAADKHVPTLGRNGRRKYFHALAVIVMLPGIAFDPAFLHLSLSAAFALFVFVEYVRYFALYPFGAAVHLFLNEFLDHKDSGTAILSHFYLLAGCAGPLWLEGSFRVLELSGILCLGVGDAMASIVGKRIGRQRWSPHSPKTIEGSAAFVVSVVFCAWAVSVLKFLPPFSLSTFVSAAVSCALLEAVSMQNDNLTLPLYMWTILVLLEYS